MAQFVIYGHRAALAPRVAELSDAIHRAAVGALRLPPEKRFHRFIVLEPGFLVTPPDRSDDYVIVEVSMFEGRTVQVKKDMIRALIREIGGIGIAPNDIEITITETPRENWGIRGVPADELRLGYAVDI